MEKPRTFPQTLRCGALIPISSGGIFIGLFRAQSCTQFWAKSRCLAVEFQSTICTDLTQDAFKRSVVLDCHSNRDLTMHESEVTRDSKM